MASRSGRKSASSNSTIRPDRYLRLFEALGPLIGSHDAAGIFDAACKLIADLLEVEACSILMHEASNRGLILRGATHIPRKEWDSVCLPVKSGVCGRVFSTGKTLLLRKESNFAEFDMTPRRRYGKPSCVVAPLFIDGKVRGVINIANPKRGRVFTARDVGLIEAAARLIANGIENAYLFEEKADALAHLEEILENLHIGVVALDADLHVTHGNHRFRELLLPRGTRLKGRPLKKVIGPDLFGVCRRLIQESRRRDGVSQERTELGTGGEERWFEITASVVRGSASGESLLMVEDVSQEEEVERLREADAMKQGFLRIISHELRTPLTVISGALPLLKSCCESATGSSADNLALVERLLSGNVNRLSSVINSILDVVEIENSSFKLSLQPFDLEELIADQIEHMKEQAEQKELSWQTDFAAGLPPVLGDRQRLRQTFYELFDNAIKFSPSGGTIRVETKRNGSMAEIRIANRGETIAEEDWEGVFEKFYQLDQSMTRRSGGCGLGLFLARNIMELHGGSIALVRGARDETVFELKLPLDEGVRAPD